MSTRPVRDLLLAERLTATETASLLAPYGFEDARRVDTLLQGMAPEPRARELLAGILEQLLASISASGDPEHALTSFARLLDASLNRVELLSYLRDSPSTVELLARLFGVSSFMAEILFRHPHYLYWIADPQVLRCGRSRRELERDLDRVLRGLRDEGRQLDALRVFKRKELLHIGARDVLRLASVEQTLDALSRLAEVLIRKAYAISEASLQRELGLARRGRVARALAREFLVVALGKLGGGELNFSSDVDLMYVYARDAGRVPLAGQAQGLSRSDYFSRLSRRLTAALASVTPEGFLFRVDLRLRPEGRSGPVALSLPAVGRYYAARGATWERLALLKAWPAAGSRRLGARFLERAARFVYSRPLDAAALEQVRRLKDRIDQEMAARGQQQRHVKLGFGGIREIELSVQLLQVAFARRHRPLRQRNTLAAIRALQRAGLLAATTAEALEQAYRFLRDVENKLQMVADAQTHSLPADPAAIRVLARRLGYRDGAQDAGGQFRDDYARHTREVHRILRAVLYEDASIAPRPGGPAA